MANGKIKTLYSDKEKTEALFPRTKTSAVSDANGVGLDSIMENLAYVDTNGEDVTVVPVDADTLGGRPAGDYATQSFVTNKIAEAQLGGDGGEIDLSGYATKDDVANIDFPVDSVNGKTGVVQLGASDVGALPITGGTLTGALSVGEKARMWTDTEGGNIRLYSPDGKTTDYWEMDSSDGNKFRIFAYRNATHANGEGYVMPLYVYSDGSIGVGDAAKTRERLGAASESHSHKKSDISDFPSSMPASDVYAWAKASTKPSYTADEVGAINAASVSLVNMSVKEWADSVTGSAWAYTNSSTTDTPAEVSAANNYAIATVISVANGGWKELRLNYLVTGCVAVCVYNYGWKEWEWENPPMTVGTEYRTTKRYAGSPVYTKLIDCGALPNASTKVVEITGSKRIIYAEGVGYPSLQKLPTQSRENWIGNVVSFNYNVSGSQLAITTSANYSDDKAVVLVEYIK